MQPPGMMDEVFAENRSLQHPEYIHKCDQLCKTCQVILTMGGVKMAAISPLTPTTQTRRAHLDELTHARFDYDECNIKANPNPQLTIQ